MAKIIVVEGTDGSGKETQSKILAKRLREAGKLVVERRFPCYESDSSTLVKNYLSGKYGEKADDVNPYAASIFFMADRIASFKEEWERFMTHEDLIIILDRYTTSNDVHQAGKLREHERPRFLAWLHETEHTLCKLPEPDLVLFLDMSIEAAQELREGRSNKITGETKQDIHESDIEHLRNAAEAGRFCCKLMGWKKIQCCKNGKAKPIFSIADTIFDRVEAML